MDPTDERSLPAADQGHAKFSIQGFVDAHDEFVDLGDRKGDNLNVGVISRLVRNRKDPSAALQFPVETPAMRSRNRNPTFSSYHLCHLVYMHGAEFHGR